MNISAFRNRLQIDTSNRIGVEEVLNGGSPFFWNGAATQFELGFFRGETIVDDLSNINEVKIEVKDLNDLNGPAVMSKAILGDDLNTELSAQQWKAGEEDDCHAKVFFGAEESNLDLGDATEKPFWMVITAKRSDGQPITLGCTRVIVAEDGSSLSDLAPGSGYLRYAGGFPESKFEDGTWHRWKPVIAEGQYLFDIEQVASSEIADVDFSKTRFNEGYLELQFPDDTWHRFLPLQAQDRYLYDIDQNASASFTQNTDHFRQRLGHAEMQFADDTWHRIKPVKSQGKYIIDVEQSASV